MAKNRYAPAVQQPNILYQEDCHDESPILAYTEQKATTEA